MGSMSPNFEPQIQDESLETKRRDETKTCYQSQKDKAPVEIGTEFQNKILKDQTKNFERNESQKDELSLKIETEDLNESLDIDSSDLDESLEIEPDDHESHDIQKDESSTELETKNIHESNKINTSKDYE